MQLRVIVLLLCLLSRAQTSTALDHVTIVRDGQRQQVAGRILVTAEDGGMLLLATDGVLWTLKASEVAGQTSDDAAFDALRAEDIARRALGELPASFLPYHTAHYVILHNTSRAYVEWCGSLFERLHMAFYNYWDKKGFDLHEQEFPLVAIVFPDAASFDSFSRSELGGPAGSIIGFYSERSNRMIMYDLSGIEAFRRPGDRRGSTTGINQILSRPEAERMVATIIHEATHQLAFNAGLQTRYADNPRWMSEGLAEYFETPDLTSRRGWRTIGAVNTYRLNRFREYVARRPANSLSSLVADDTRCNDRDSSRAEDAYAEAWALTYFLIRQRPEQYRAYLRRLAEKPRLQWDSPEQRLDDFRAAFGVAPADLEAEFLREISRLR